MSEFKPGTVIADTEGVLYFVIEVSENTRSAWKAGQCVISADGNGHHNDALPDDWDSLEGPVAYEAAS